MKRGAGILMPIFSLPCKENFSTLKDGYEFVDFLVKSKLSYWQVLPINDVDEFNSPFRSTCINSGNPLFISLEEYLTNKEKAELLKIKDFNEYKKAKKELLFKIFKRNKFDLKDFVLTNPWVIPYSEYMTIKDEYVTLDKFPGDLKNRESRECHEYLNNHQELIDFYCFCQYLFFKQWFALKEYANNQGIMIIGDSPCNSALDSKEAWADKNMYLLNENLEPTFVAGVPPDYFSSTGQVWNTLIYNYEYLKNDNYQYLIDKYKYLLKVYNYLKIDHFRGLEYYYKIPYGREDGVIGEWCPGPGYPFIDLLKQNKIENLILEDLGIISEGVIRLKDYSGYPGMKVYQFAFDEENSPFLPDNYPLNCVCYSGTHDNDTFYSFISEKENKEKVIKYLGLDLDASNEKVVLESIKKLCESRANVVIINPQDLLFEGKEYRFNTPGTIKGNWQYHCKRDLYNLNNIEFLKQIIVNSKRSD